VCSSDLARRARRWLRFVEKAKIKDETAGETRRSFRLNT